MRIRLRCPHVFDITVLPTRNREAELAEIRRLRQEHRSGHLHSESTKSEMYLAVIDLHSHLERYKRGDTDRERVRRCLEYFFQNERYRPHLILFAHEAMPGSFTKYTVDLEEFVQDRQLLGAIMVKVCSSAEEAENEELVIFPREGGPRKPQGYRIDEFYFEDKIIGLSMFEVLRQLSDPSLMHDEHAREIKHALFLELLDNQAYFQAVNAPSITKSIDPTQTGEKLVRGVSAFASLTPAELALLMNLGDLYDTFVCVRRRDAWLFNQRLDVLPTLKGLELPSPPRLDARDMYPDFMSRVVRSTYECRSLPETITLQRHSVYQTDFGSITRLTTERRDVTHILRSAVSNLSPEEFKSYDSYFGDRFFAYSGQRLSNTEPLGLTLFNNHLRCAWAFQEKQRVPGFESYRSYHLQQAFSSRSLEQVTELLSPPERDVLSSLVGKIRDAWIND